MRGNYPGVPKLGYPTVDVRDVVDLHFHVLNDDDAHGERYGHRRHPALQNHGPRHPLRPPRSRPGKWAARELPNWFLRVFSLFEPTTRVILAELGYMPEVAHDKAKRLVRLDTTHPEVAAVATADSLIDLGVLR